MSRQGTAGRVPANGAGGDETTPNGTDPAESTSERGPNGSSPVCARAAASEVNRPPTCRVHGSTSSFAGSVRTPVAGDHGPCTRSP